MTPPEDPETSPSMARTSKSTDNRLLRNGQSYVSQLDLFAGEFDTEAKLRRVVGDLFRKMGHNGVRITHGPNEKGKDIVFYSDGPLGERRLFACVVKNDPITGQADNHRTGAPTLVTQLQGVLNQIESAFSEPLTDGKGKDEWVDSVYLISPYECTTQTIDSVKSRLQRSGQISFICGHSLMELFAKHWREFLWFESTILASYLSSLRKGLEEDYALATLILQKSYLSTLPGSLSDLYVEPTFYRELRQFHLDDIHLMNLNLFFGPRLLREINEEKKFAKTLSMLLHTSPIWADHPDLAIQTSEDILTITDDMEKLWRVSYRNYFAKLRNDARQNQPRSAQGYAASGAFVSVDNIQPSEHEVSVELHPSEEIIFFASKVHGAASEFLNELRAKASTASHVASAPHVNALTLLGAQEFLTYCRVAEIASIVPQAFRNNTVVQNLLFGEDLLDKFPGSLLITGPAGFGKTTFCRWHAIRDATRLVQKQAAILPVYRALHPLSRGQLGSFEDVFFPSDELKKLIQQRSVGQSPFERIRLYLDGLDEITSVARQEEIVQLAEQVAAQWPFVQVVFTARDHVINPALRWLPRIRLSELGEAKIRILVERWLGTDRIDSFFDRLSEGGNIAELMRIPLLATLVLAVYRKTNSVPPNKTNLYTLFVELLCGGWDFYKSIQRRASQFSVRDKEVVLARLAGILQINNRRDATESDFRSAIQNSINSMTPDWEQFLQDIVEDGLLVRIGTDLTFSHLSFQEFLAARDLRDHMGNRPKLAMSRYFSGQDWWREVLAFYVTLLDRPGEADEWLIKRAIASSAIVPDLGVRVQYLRRSLKAACPAYKETSAVEKLLAQLRNKTERFESREALVMD